MDAKIIGNRLVFHTEQDRCRMRRLAIQRNVSESKVRFWMKYCQKNEESDGG